MSLETQVAPAPEPAKLTIDQAVERAIERNKPTAAAPAPKQQQAKAKAPEPVAPEPVAEEISDDVPESADEVEIEDSEAEPQTADDVESEPQEANADDDEAETVEPAEPAIELPQFWDAEGKDSFAKLPKAAQQAVLAYEKQRTVAVAKAMEKSAVSQRQYEAKQKQLQQAVEEVGVRVDAEAENIAKWDAWIRSADAAELAQTDPARYVAARAEYDQIKGEHEAAKSAKAKAEDALFQDHWSEFDRIIPIVSKELATNPALHQKISGYLQSQGDGKAFPPDRLKFISPWEAAISLKAMKYDAVPNFDEVVKKAALYDKAQKLAATAPSKPKPPKAGPSAPPTGQGQAPSSAEARFKQLSSLKSLTIDQAAEKAMLRAKLRK